MPIKVKKGINIKKRDCDVTCNEIRKDLIELWGNDKSDSTTLLAFADDGLIWGYLTDAGLFIARDADEEFGPPLRWETLQRLHLFRENKELRIWKNYDNFKGVVLSDEQCNDAYYYDEEQILLGTHVREGHETKMANDIVPFTPIEDLAGQWHAPPIAKNECPSGSSRLRLQLRHYLQEDEETGMLKVSTSRIRKLISQGEKK